MPRSKVPTRNPLQQLIAQHIDETGERLSDIADRGCVPRQTLSAIYHREARSIPRRATLAGLAVGLGIDLDIVERAASVAASSDVSAHGDEDERLTTLIAYARRLDDAHLRALVTTARALVRVE